MCGLIFARRSRCARLDTIARDMLAASCLAPSKRKVGLVLKRGAPHARDAAREVVGWLGQQGVELGAEADDAGALGIPAVHKAEMFASFDAIVVLGGDGTLLATARHAGDREVPLIGVNLGRLGFLTELTLEELRPALERTLAGKAEIDRRRMLRAVVQRGDGGQELYQALNDAVLSRGSLGRTIDIEAKVDGAFLRRIPYKIEVPDPSREDFTALFELMSPIMGFEFDKGAIDYLIEKHYLPVNRPFRACQPRDLLLQVKNFCTFKQVPKKLTPEFFDHAVENYFSVM